MADAKLYLKRDVQIEPLVNQWYAWPHLVAPATAALNIVHHHVKVLRSYVMAPEIHAAAVRNPAMRGGPFLDFDAGRVHEIKALLERTVREQAHLFAFADAIKSLNDLLLAHERGGSLEALYPRVPDVLRGYVELTYDLNSRAGFRVIERLLYRSRYYDRSLQSVAMSVSRGEERPFVFSTPRIPGEGQIHLPIAFDHVGIDALARMRQAPAPLGALKDVLRLGSEHDALLSTFLTTERPRGHDPYVGDGVRVRHLGHACLLIETRAVRILIDPLIGYGLDGEACPCAFGDLPDRIDYVLLTHSHSDHVVFESLLQLRHKVGTVVVPRSGGTLEDPSLKLALEAVGFRDVREVDELETLEVPGGSFMAVPFLGEHGDLDIRSKTAHLVRLEGRSLLCTADSKNLEPRLYEHVRAVVGELDALFVGMECDGAPVTWMYGALLLKPLDRKMDQSRSLSASDCVQALDVVERFGCKRVYVYAMGQEPWLRFITSIQYTEASKPIVESRKLVEACRGRGIPAERLEGRKEIVLA